MALDDLHVWLPNAVGAVMGLIQLLLIGLFRRSASMATAGADEPADARAAARVALIT